MASELETVIKEMHIVNQTIRDINHGKHPDIDILTQELDLLLVEFQKELSIPDVIHSEEVKLNKNGG